MQQREIVESAEFGENENKLINISRKGINALDSDYNEAFTYFRKISVSPLQIH